MITEKQYKEAADTLGCTTAAIKAVVKVESNGNGLNKNGKPKILFEGHIFWKQLLKIGIDPLKIRTGNEDILYPSWIPSMVRKYYNMNQCERLEKAMKINADAACKSASWGAFQIMGFNHMACGYATVHEFVSAQYDEYKQMLCFCNYIKSNYLNVHLQHLDWAGFARAYNGPDYAKNQYHIKLKRAYDMYAGATPKTYQ